MSSRGIGLIIVLAIVAVAVIGITLNKPKPVPLNDAAGRFSVVFPDTYKQTTDSKYAPVIMQMFECKRRGGKYYGVMYSDYPPQLVQMRGADHIINVIAQSTAGSENKITSITDIKNSIYCGKEYFMVGQRTPRGMHICERLFIINNRLYAVMVGGPGKNLDPDDRKFLDSFKIN